MRHLRANLYRIAVQLLCALNLLYAVGFSADESVTGLKLVEKGVKRETIALMALIAFPFQMIVGWLTAQWSSGKTSLRPWLLGYAGRLGFSVIWLVAVAILPKSPNEGGSLFVLTFVTILSGLVS